MNADRHITTDETLAQDLRASLIERRHGSVHTGLTWADFKTAMTALGVTDEDHVASIEFGVTAGTGRICRDDAPDGIEIREKRS